MEKALRDTNVYGSREFPFALFHIRRLRQMLEFSPHWHDEVELIYVLQGQLNLTIEGQTFSGKTGDVFVVNSREIHGMTGTPPTEIVVVLFPLTSLLFRQEDAVDEQYLLPLIGNRVHFPRQVTSERLLPRLRESISGLMALYDEKPACYMLMIRVRLLQMVCDFFASGCMVLTEQDSGLKSKKRAVLSYVNENLFRELTMEEVAGEFYMVPKYFSRYFKTNFHIAFTEYVNRLRLEKAAELLLHTELTVTEIAIRTGFNSSSYFNKKFRSVYEKTPTDYRAMHRQDP